MNQEPTTLQKIGAGIWSFLCLLGRAAIAILKWIADRREVTIWPIVVTICLLVFAAAFFVVTGYKLLSDVGDLATTLLSLLKIGGVVALCGAMKTRGYLLSDIQNENDEKTPWQKVVGSDFAFVTLVCFLSWLVLSR